MNLFEIEKPAALPFQKETQDKLDRFAGMPVSGVEDEMFEKLSTIAARAACHRLEERRLVEVTCSAELASSTYTNTTLSVQ